MADVKICDRCGKKIETKAWPIYVHHYRSILDMEDADYKHTYDLCGDWTKRLYEFVKGGATEGTTEATDE